MYQKLSLLLLAVTGDSRESWQERFDVTRPSCFFSFTLPTVFSARAAKTQTKQHCTSRRQTYVLEESVSWHSPCARVCVHVWSLPSIEQPGVCYMERRKPNFFFFPKGQETDGKGKAWGFRGGEGSKHRASREAKRRTCTLTTARQQGSFLPYLWEKVDWDSRGMLKHLWKRHPLKKV